MTTSRLSGEERIALAGLLATFVVTAVWWALALWPVSNAPEWLTRTRYVCFGVGDRGLPDAGGWIGLIAGPLGMTGIVVVGWGAAMRQLLRRTRQSPLIASVFSGLILGTILLGLGAGLRVRNVLAAEVIPEAPAGLPPATYPRLDRAAPPLALVAHDGQAFDLTALRGKPVLITFAYAHCTTICPVIVRDVLVAQQQLAAKSIAAAVVVVTLDPWRDTPSRLAAMARDWKLPAADAWMLGGSVDDVEAALAAWQVPYRRDARTGEVIHPSLVYIVDRQGEIAYASTGGAEALTELTRRIDQPD